MNNKYYFFLLLIIGFVFLLSCEEDTETVNYDSSPYTFTYGGLPTPDLPSDNKLTLEGVKLGRMLFYEPLLSKDKMQSCATCHVQKDGFSDINQFSKGVEGKFGGRQAMTVFNENSVRYTHEKSGRQVFFGMAEHQNLEIKPSSLSKIH